MCAEESKDIVDVETRVEADAWEGRWAEVPIPRYPYVLTAIEFDPPLPDAIDVTITMGETQRSLAEAFEEPKWTDTTHFPAEFVRRMDVAQQQRGGLTIGVQSRPFIDNYCMMDRTLSLSSAPPAGTCIIFKGLDVIHGNKHSLRQHWEWNGSRLYL